MKTGDQVVCIRATQKLREGVVYTVLEDCKDSYVRLVDEDGDWHTSRFQTADVAPTVQFRSRWIQIVEVSSNGKTWTRVPTVEGGQ